MQVKLPKVKHIDLHGARTISKKFCEDFNIIYCEIFYVDTLGENLGVYCYLNPPHILIEDSKKNVCKIGVLMHELTHHLEGWGYEYDIGTHGYYFQLAKQNTVTWCRKNISSKPNWYLALKAVSLTEEMKDFKL